MKFLIRIFIFSLLTASVFASELYDSHSIYVKFKHDSKESQVQSISPDYTVEQVFSTSIPTHREINLRADSLLSELRKVKRITFRSTIDPFKMAQKFMRQNNVEYAEPIPKSTIFADETNDPELERLYQLYITNAFEAWELMTGDSVVIGIVDTGIDFEHEDLANVVWYNEGENGKDNEGNDKSTNGIDDDENGYIDDWRGWDFGSESGYNNNASYGSDHGVHVCGIAAAQSNNEKGISGICPIGKILPVKIGPDFGLNNTVNHEYEGLLYAAIMGADVINCSWGSPGYSKTNGLVVETATELGSLVVAAAGNNNNDDEFYPASYKQVISVASTDDEDGKSSFSNFNSAVDISAPGTFIFSTVPNDKYDYKSGTSMASPVTAGAAAVIISQFPDYTPQQIKSLLEVNADNIDESNANYIGQLGSGRLNLANAIRRDKKTAIIITDYSITNNNESNIIEIGKVNKLDISFKNVLDSIGSLEIIIADDRYVPVEISKKNFTFQELSTDELFDITGEITFTIPENTPEDYTFNIPLMVYYEGEYLQKLTVSFVANPSYLTLENEEVGITITSNGNIGFNDYPNNIQGVGFSVDGRNALFESGFMITQVGEEYVADGVRNRSGKKSKDLFSIDKIQRNDNSVYSVITSKFTDKTDGIGNFDSLALGIDITQRSYLFTQSDLRNSILIRYELFNKNDFDIDSIYAGLFFDWDYSNDGADDHIYFDSTTRTGIVEVLGSSSTDFGKIGVKSHSDIPFNCYAIDNAPFSDEMGIYDGFTEAEKQMTMSSGIGRVASRERRDASMVSAVGPLYLPAGEKAEFYFSISVADDVIELNEHSDSIDKIAANLDNISSVKVKHNLEIMRLSPNPVSNNQTVNVLVKSEAANEVKAQVYDYRGKVVIELGTIRVINGYNPFEFNTQNLSQGAYYFVIEEDGELFTYPFTVVND